MSNTMLAVVIGGVLLLGLGVVGLVGWSWGHASPSSMPTAMAQGQTYSNVAPMNQGGMMGGYGPGMMGQMGSMMGRGNWGGMMSGWGMGGMHNGMMGGGGCCGGMQSYSPGTTQQPAAVETNAVALSQFAFNPQVIRVRTGTTVTWINRDNVPHTVAARDGSFRSGLLQPGQPWSFTFDKPGTYGYYCEPHPFMQGQIIVEGEAGK